MAYTVKFLDLLRFLCMEAKRPRGNPNWRKGVSANPGGQRRADAIRTSPPVTLPVKPLPEDKRSHSAWLALAAKGVTDGWQNLITGHGVASRDKRLGARFYTDPVCDEEAREIWRGDPLAARIVESLPDEMLREPFHVRIPDDADGNDEEYGAELVKRVEAKWKALGLVDALHEALCQERALGGSAIVLGADDGAAAMTEPLNLKRIRSFEWLTVLEPRECTPVAWYTDPRAAKFGQPEIYQLTPIVVGAPRPGATIAPSNVLVHETRLIVFRGTRVSRVNQFGTYMGWGDSIFTRVFRVLADFNAAWSGAGTIVSEFAVPVFQIEGLAEMVAQDNTQLFQARMQALAMAMSTVRAALIDKNESYERKQTPVTGLPELLELFCKLLAGVAETPVSVLWGEAPGGLNASGAQGDQLQIWRNRVRSKQTKKLEPAIRYVTEIIMAVMGGVPDEYWIEFDPLHAPSSKEEADEDKVVADTACALVDRQVLSPEEVRRAPGFAKRWGIVVEDDVEETAEPGAADVTEMLEGAKPDPAAPAAGAAAGVNIQTQVLNGAQVTSMIEVVRAAVNGEIPREAAIAMLELGFQLSNADATRLLCPVNFEAKKPDPPPFGGGAPFPPKAPPAGDKPEPEAKADGRTIADLIDKLAPSGKCGHCGEVKPLEVQHMNGRDWQPRDLSHAQRAAKYWDEYERGVKLEAWCRTCNASDGAKNKQEHPKRGDEPNVTIERVTIQRVGQTSQGIARLNTDGSAEVLARGDLEPFPVPTFKDGLELIVEPEH